MGGLIIYGNDNIGFVFIALGLYFLINYINFLNRYKRNRKVYFDNVEKHIVEYLSHEQTLIWKFEEEHFCYSDFKYDLKISWTAFTTFKILDDRVLLELKDNIIGTFVLSKEEIGHQNFQKIIIFLESKIKKNGIL